ncbi:MAG TPA: alpha/beta hydrolase fold domain-containing protein [Spongiibacteraceae bacterium]|nr:alpha/beta hydrolase fold domain-containing protein [Spongiibacteraceae bacterium]
MTSNLSDHITNQSADFEKIDAAGTVHVPAFQLPLSSFMSTAARQAFIEQNFNPPGVRSAMRSTDIATLRSGMDKFLFGPMLERAKARYAVQINEEKIAGIPVSIVSPEAGIAEHNRKRVLINLHGGYFTVGAGLGGLVESVPMAALGNIKIVSIDYRQGPEHRFPAASEDVASVYRQLLQQYAPENIGIYGSSAGGILSAMALAWFQKEQLPMPGAVALLSAGALPCMDGDSGFCAPAMIGETPPPPHPNRPLIPVAYLLNTDMHDPLVAPTVALDVLAKFPPTLLLTGTRAFDLSATIHTQRRLMQANSTVELQLWDGMWHCFFYDAELPEAQEAFKLTATFFSRHLGAIRC